ncbi:MAG: 2-amino-4-hydroxy-6-hydroxymethyldihydropteridine diphosphokinase [Proteobacteria bacterium]|nr:2-amino-4-hydroxy-6-hydroxymethyldihydropteridine diphosphokinase [Pseudomonadota bacterium]
MHCIFLGIGSNINRKANLLSCLSYLTGSFKNIQVSPVYRSASYGFSGSDFFNLVVRIKTEFDPVKLKIWLQQLERLHGRDHKQARYSDRTLDIDLLLIDDLIIDDGFIQVPRQEICQRKYVLKPLVDLAPDLIHPSQKKRLATLWQALAATDNSSLSPIIL